MINRVRGDAPIRIDGTVRRLRLTFGALAEIESGLGVCGLGELGARLARLGAADLMIVLAALLRGGEENEGGGADRRSTGRPRGGGPGDRRDLSRSRRMSPAPWGDMLAAAVRMGIAPETFWRLSVREWRLLAAGFSGPAAMGRAQLDELAVKFPDQEHVMAENGNGVLGAELAEAGAALEAFANGPAKAAGDALQAAFARAGGAIRGELSSLAKSGEADLDRLGRAIVETLAKLAVSQLGGGAREAGSPVNVTMNFSGGASGADAMGSSNQIAAAVARAVQRGARFS